MRQVFQDLKAGETQLVEVPAPVVRPGFLLVETRTSLISAGTERMLVAFGRANLLQKARQQPDRVRQVVQKAKTDGLLTTWDSVRAKLGQPLALGYCNVGTVVEVGAGVEGFRPGDRVASNGAHAEVVCVPVNLCAAIPEGVSDEAASFAVLGSIGLQSVRLTQPALGETVVVTGLGLLGLMIVQMLRAAGCRVLGIDPDRSRRELAERFGAVTVDASSGVEAALGAVGATKAGGVDAVIIAAATKDEGPVHQAAQLCRKRGRIVLVGVAGLELDRNLFYEKELSFQVSCAYGPGRYDAAYEERAQDYPLPYVRWTAGRNIEAVLGLMDEGRLDVAPLVSHRFELSDSPRAYELVATRSEPYLGIVLEYPPPAEAAKRRDETKWRRTIDLAATNVPAAGKAVVGVVGAGGFTGLVMLPELVRAGATVRCIANRGGSGAALLARRHGVARVSSNLDEIFDDPQINTVVITTRHDTHAALTCRALRAGKHVLVEKPLALNEDEVQQVEQAYREATQQRGTAPLLLVGFNRRFSPHARRARELIERLHQPVTAIVTVNAGYIPADHWTQNREVGGGRILGEGCHFIDLLRYLVGQPVEQVQAARMGETSDSASITLRFTDGSVGTVHYLANGHKAFPKERVDLFCGGRIIQLDNFKMLRTYGLTTGAGARLLRQDKGHRAEVAAFVRAIAEGGAAPIALDELLEVTRVTLAADAALL